MDLIKTEMAYIIECMHLIVEFGTEIKIHS